MSEYPARISPKEAPLFLASKWLHFDLLVDTSEFEQLFSMIAEPLFLFSSMGVSLREKNSIALPDFLAMWQRYIDTLSAECPVQDADFRFFFTCMLTRDLGALRALDLPNDREVVVPYTPLMQMQLHRFSYSDTDKKFHSQAFGAESISWGVRLSYPQIFQDAASRKVENAQDKTQFINAELVSIVRTWLRRVSQPTPFIVNGTRTNVPMRIGNNCFSWIEHHPDLIRRHLQVERKVS